MAINLFLRPVLYTYTMEWLRSINFSKVIVGIVGLESLAQLFWFYDNACVSKIPGIK